MNQKTFNDCMSKIGILLDIPSLIPHLQVHGLATNSDDTATINNPFYEPHMRSASVATLPTVTQTCIHIRRLQTSCDCILKTGRLLYFIMK